MGPAGVRGDVSPDHRLLGRARIGREPEAILTGETADLRRRHPRVDGKRPRLRTPLTHAAKPVDGEDDSVGEGDGAGRVPGATAAWNDRHAMLPAEAHGGLHGGHVGGPDDRERLAGDRGTFRAVREPGPIVDRRKDGVLAERRLERLEERITHRQPPVRSYAFGARGL